MRKFQKEQLLDIFTSLHELHRKCRDKMEQKEYQTVQTALSDCQEAAIQMGEAIEKLVGEGTDAVSYLEQYCERLYNLSLQIEELSAQKFYKSLEEILIKAENAVKHMPVRKEVVFFPYKASMWDSLESVYLAAKEDENCDAYCVPIPYYDRRADGSIGQMHYEGNEYPKNIEVIDYRTYNVEQRHPDAIYIHNPYDEWNHVTCVPERYFARNLRNYTDELVYIPYFVLDEIEPDDQARIEGMKHFCFTPGVIYANKVIVQSEKMRQIYINEYIKAAKESGLSGEHTDRKYLEQKILGLGSPKFDKVLNTKKEDLEIPEEWLKIIGKPDGSWKKIIFYNTSISALLQHDEQMLEKMKDVFRVFKENQDEVALLWRPHPLVKTTIESMRPQLWQEYSKIVEQYRNEGWGIYDDSADMDRAVVLSDAYYGDGSSVVQVYQRTEKPIMIQCVDIIVENKYFWASAFCKVQDDIWFIHGNVAILCKYNMLKKETTVIGMLPVKNKCREYLFEKIVFYNEKLFIIPCWADEIVIYDINNNSFCKIDLEYTNRMKFCNAFIYRNKIVCVPYTYPFAISIDVDTFEICNEYSIENAILNEGADYVSDSIKIDKQIYMVSPQKNAIWKYDLDKQVMDKLVISNVDGISSICKAGKSIVLCSNTNKKILLIDSDLHNVKDVFWPDGVESLKIMGFDEKTFIVDNAENVNAAVYDTEFRLVKIIAPLYKGKKRNTDCPYFCGISERYDDEQIYFNQAEYTFCIYGKYKDEYIEMPIEDECKQNIDKMELVLHSRGVLKESVLVSLSEYIASLIHNL